MSLDENDMSEMLHIFSEEAEDLLTASEESLLALEENLEDPEHIGSLFRAFHTIKGSAGIFGLDPVVAFTHVVESVLMKARDGDLTLDTNLVTLFLECRDHLEKLVAFVLEGGTELSGDLQVRDQALLGELKEYLDNFTATSERKEEEFAATIVTSDSDGVLNKNWHISLRFGEDALRIGMDPLSFIGYLRGLGTIETLTLLDDALPVWGEMDVESCYLGFEISLSANTTKDAIEEVFEFVRDDCDIAILPPGASVNNYLSLIRELPEESMRIGEILLASGALTEQELDVALGEQTRLADELTGDGVSDSTPALGEVIVQQQMVQPEVVKEAVKKQETVKAQATKSQQSVRVNASKLEALIDLVGELVIGGANADLMARRTGDETLVEAMENMSRLVEDIRDTTLGLRMVQIGDTFNRFKRVVREGSKDLNKEINLIINGADTELDKTVVEKIGDPLMHLVRNAMDHGLESTEERLAAGKPAEGVVTLDAFHDSGSIVISINDDGGGINRDVIYDKAVEKGLIDNGAVLSDNEVYRLIFEAGFSTAEAVTNISGRGVGMDVVRRNIEALRGQIDIESKLGEGSSFVIRLPLTMAIIDGFEVRVGDGHYIVPLDMVDECIELDQELTEESSKRGDYINLRGEVLPFIRLENMFGVPTEEAECKRHNIVVTQFAGQKTGLVVDELLGEHQTVIKPLGKVFENLESISGATILGSGEVALIVDVPSLVHRVTHNLRRSGNHQATPHNSSLVH